MSTSEAPVPSAPAKPEVKKSNESPDLDKTQEAAKGSDRDTIKSAFAKDIAEIDGFLKEALAKYTTKSQEPKKEAKNPIPQIKPDSSDILGQIRQVQADFNNKKGKLTDELNVILAKDASPRKTAEIQEFLTKAKEELASAIAQSIRADSAEVGLLQKMSLLLSDAIPEEGMAAKWLLDMVEGLRGFFETIGMGGMMDNLTGEKYAKVYGKEIAEKLAKKGILFDPIPLEMKNLIGLWRDSKKEGNENAKNGFDVWFEKTCMEGTSFKGLKTAIESRLAPGERFLYTPKDFIPNTFSNIKDFNTILGSGNKSLTANELRKTLDSGAAEQQTIMRSELDKAEIPKKNFDEILNLAQNPQNETFSKKQFGEKAEWKKMVQEAAEVALLGNYALTAKEGKLFAGTLKVEVKPIGDKKGYEISYGEGTAKKTSPPIAEKDLKTAFEFLGGNPKAIVFDDKGEPKEGFKGEKAKEFWNGAKEMREKTEKFLEILTIIAAKVSDTQKSDDGNVHLKNGEKLLKISAEDGKTLIDSQNYTLDPAPTPPLTTPITKEVLKTYLETWVK